MPKQEKQEQPKEPKTEPKYQYFWSANVYTMANRKTENCFGVIGADTGQGAVDKVTELYSVKERFRNFALVALNRV